MCSADVASPPAFLMERTYIASVRQFINATAAGDTVRLTIDMRNMFPQARNVRPHPPPHASMPSDTYAYVATHAPHAFTAAAASSGHFSCNCFSSLCLHPHDHEVGRLSAGHRSLLHVLGVAAAVAVVAVWQWQAQCNREQPWQKAACAALVASGPTPSGVVFGRMSAVFGADARNPFPASAGCRHLDYANPDTPAVPG